MASRSSRSWRCPLCHSFAARSLKGVLRHIGAVHAHEANLWCTGLPVLTAITRKHMYLKHRDVLEVGSAPTVTEVQSLESTDTADFDISSVDTTMQPTTTCYDDKRHSALFLLKATV